MKNEMELVPITFIEERRNQREKPCGCKFADIYMNDMWVACEQRICSEHAHKRNFWL